MAENKKSELEIWLAFYLCKGLGIVSALSLIERFELIQIPNLTASKLISVGLSEKVAHNFLKTDWQRVSDIISYCNDNEIKLVHHTNDHYPSLLREIHSAPLLLFCVGNINLLHSHCLAIVGSRKASHAGLQSASDIAKELVYQNITVVSGMAMGIDGAAHRGALECKGNTIAVLGTGVDVIYPKRHKTLYQHIKKTGLLISEFLPGARPLGTNFPKRNRIIAGLSLGCIVVEAEIQSGSLVSAKYALEQNREVFAVPGSIYNPMAKGCHQLIKQGAKLIENIDDILQELSGIEKSCLYKYRGTDYKEDFDPLLQHVGYEVTSVDTVATRSGLAVSEVLNRLLDLELSQQVERVLDGYVRLGRS